MTESPKPRPKRALKGKYKPSAAVAEITPYVLKQIEGAAALGLPRSKVADLLGISKATYDRRSIDNPGMEEAYRRGRVNAMLRVTKVAFDAASSGDDPQMTRWWINRNMGLGLAKGSGFQEEERNEKSPDAQRAREMELVRSLVEMSEEELEAQKAQIEMELSEGGVFQKKA